MLPHDQLLSLRKEGAAQLGYPSYADMALVDTMVRRRRRRGGHDLIDYYYYYYY